MMKKYMRKISDFAMVGGISALVVGIIAGCDNTQSSQKEQASQTAQAIQEGAFVLLEEQPNGGYKILEEYPSQKTHIVVRNQQGEERVLSDEEVQNLLKQEEAKIDNGTSSLTSSNPTSMESGGLSLGGAILASAAGALIGSYIGNKLFNNPNYQQNRQRTYKSPQAYERSANSFNKTQSTSAGRATTPSNAKTGFFGNSSSTSSSATKSSGGSLGG
ncbi:secreted protein [Helicobacter fennelliae]|uniref:Secreted protein n=3 Tax=Helicobacter fennelliae TaxID=215 RepID=T1D4J5_9HELI|nr:secreted protein [Helicobacter fennelliae MRY12-0050]SQB98761.1 secreted protein [Helicobacter fennelliae]STP08103.1 secreted protein [Helicobacter fennelliae]STQ83989.1 secreted protein [Helicobacter fennelliae]